MATTTDPAVLLRTVLAEGDVLTDAAARTVYARDASHLTLGRPGAVALPRNAERGGRGAADLRRGRACRVVCRGAGTGLSGGAVPPEGRSCSPWPA